LRCGRKDKNCGTGITLIATSYKHSGHTALSTTETTLLLGKTLKKKMQKGMARTMGTFYSGNSQTTADSSATLATFATISSKTQPNPATQLEKSTSFIKEKASSSSAFIPAEFKPPRQANTEIAGLLASQVLSLQDYKITGLNNVDSIFDDSDSDSEEGDGAGVNEDKTSLGIESTAFLEDPKANNDKNLGLKPHPHDSNKKNLGTLKKGVKRAEDKVSSINIEVRLRGKAQGLCVFLPSPLFFFPFSHYSTTFFFRCSSTFQTTSIYPRAWSR